MLDIPENIKELFRADNNRTETVKHLKLRFYDKDISLLFPDNMLFPSDDLFPVDMEPFLIIENDRINTESFTLTESLCESEDLTFGECNASKIEITVADITLDVTGKEFLATVEVGGYELAFGIYRVESFIRQADRRMRKITAYDRMRYFQKDVATWYNALIFPMPLKQFRASLCEYIGIKEVSTPLPLDDMQITKTIEPQQISGLDVLQAICEINGCFGHMDKTGRLKYISLGITSLFPENDLYPSEDLYPAEMLNAENISHYKPQETTYEDYLVYGIEKVQINQEEGDVGASFGDGEYGYRIQGNFLVYGKSTNELLQIAATAYDQIKGRTYRPCKIACPAFPWVEVGDGLICHTTNDIIETYCFKRTISGIQAMKDSFEATGSQTREEDFGIGTQIIQLEGKSAVIKRSVEEVSVRVTDLKNYTESQFSVTSNNILAEVKRAQEAEASLNIRADGIVTTVTNLRNDTNTRFEQTDSKISLKVSKGEVSSQLSVEDSQVTIKGNRLIVDSTNFKLDGNGNADFSGKVTGGSININNAFKVDSSGNTTIIGNKLSWTSQNSSMSENGTLTCKGLIAEGAKISGEIRGATITADVQVDSGVLFSAKIINCQLLDADSGEVWAKSGDINYIKADRINVDSLIAGSINGNSDRRLKDNIEAIDKNIAIDFIENLIPVSFTFKNTGERGIGFLAQDVKKICDKKKIDWAVYGIAELYGNEYFVIPYMNYIALIVSAIQQIKSEINILKGGNLFEDIKL